MPSAAGTLDLSRADGRGVLATTVLASGMVMLDGTIVNVATRRIGTDFGSSLGTLQWVLNGYTLALASLILLGGSLGDRLGRRRIYRLGIGWFAVASLLCALAPNAGTLITARVLQGIGGALLVPGSLSLIQASFRPDDRARAVGLWTGTTGVASVLGPLVGGALIQQVSWRWAFGINLPLAVIALVLCSRFVPESRSTRHEGPLDVIGTVLIALGLGLITYGTTAFGNSSGRLVPVLGVVLGVLLLVAFGVVEHRSSHPLLPPRLFADRVFLGANLMTFTTYAALSAFLFLFVLQLQVSAGFGPLAAGLATVPLTVLMFFGSPRAGALAKRTGPKLLLGIGPLVAAAGFALSLRIDSSHRSYVAYVLPAVLLFGLGMTILVAPLTATVMAGAAPDDVGIASGANNAVARSAGLLAVALLPVAAGLTGSAYQSASTLTHGFRIAIGICIGLQLVGSALVALTIPSSLDQAGSTPVVVGPPEPNCPPAVAQEARQPS